jgi:hypothetical protein
LRGLVRWAILGSNQGTLAHQPTALHPARASFPLARPDPEFNQSHGEGQLAREFGAYVIGTGRAADRRKALDFGAAEFVGATRWKTSCGVDLVFDVIGARVVACAGRRGRYTEPVQRRRV